MRRPSFPTVISLIALFVALGGTSYAVIKLPAKSVGNRELKSNAVSSSKIRPRGVSRSDLAPSARSGTRGPRGPAGPAGSAGDAVGPEPWNALSFVGPWASYHADWPAGTYRRDARGRVYLRGLVAKPGAPTPATNDTIAVLPTRYRPRARLLFPVATGAGTAPDAYGRVDVLSNGEIRWIAGASGDGDFTSLETIAFWAD
jgi:hypothetical protein